VYKSLLVFDVLGIDDVGTLAKTLLLNSVAIDAPYNATAIAMAKDSVAPLEELASHVIPPAFPDRAVNKYPS